MRPAQTTLEINGRTFNVGRLPASAATELFFLLLKGAGPALAEVATGLGISATPAGRFSFSGVRLDGLAVAVERLVRALPYAEFKSISDKALATTTVDGQRCADKLDAYLGGALDHFTLVWKVLVFQFSDFSSALGGLLSAPAGKTPSDSEG